MDKILVVDDSLFQRKKIVQMLNEAGFETEQCVDGQEALDYLLENTPKLILTDLLMPKVDGFGVLEELKNRGNSIPVVVLTADIQETQKARCYELGATTFLNKPPKPEQLVEAVTSSLASSSSSDIQISDEQLDAITEIFNIGIGQAARVLNEMVETHVELQIPNIKLLKDEELSEHLLQKGSSIHASVRLSFDGDMQGSSTLVFKDADAGKLVSLLTGEEEAELDSVVESTLLEVGNIVINGVMGSISNTVGKTVQYKLPEYKRDQLVGLFEQQHTLSSRLYIVADTSFQIAEKEINGEMLFLFEVESFVGLIQQLIS